MHNKSNWVTFTKLTKLWLVFIFIFSSTLAYALKSDDKAPLQIEADQATLDQKQMVSVFTGKVVITKGTLIVHADKGVASQDQGGGRVITLYGSPVTFSQMADDGQKIEGQGNNFNYNSKSGLAVLSGRARVKKGKNLVIGDVISYNAITQVFSASSDLGNGVTKKTEGRITVILDQQGSPNATAKSTK